MATVLGRLRLSVSSDESTSIARQQEAVQQWSDAHGHVIVGWATDIDVSGSIDAFDTAEFGDWLNNREHDFEIITAWKLDRLGRNSIRLNKLFGWCLDHGKVLVSTSEGIDLSTPVGRLIANVIAFLAEGELEQIRERQLSSRRKLRETARWAGGRPPFGFKAVDNRSGAGKVLEIDPESYDVVRRIVDAVINGVPLVRIARDLNYDGIRPPADHYRVSVGKPDTLSSWKPGPIKRLLLAPTLAGHAHLGGVTVRDDQGQPVRMAEPLVSDDERDLIVAELERVQAGPRERRESGPLAGIVFCWFCGNQLSQTRHTKGDHLYRYYRCHVKSCGPMIPAVDAETLVAETFIHDYGDREVTERVWVPGDTNEAELRAAVSAFDELSETVGLMASKTAKDRLQRQLAALDARIAGLEATPAREGRWELQPTGEKYRDVWDRHADDPDARREMLKRSEIKIRIGISGVGKRSLNQGGAWHFEIESPIPLDDERAREERLRLGISG